MYFAALFNAGSYSESDSDLEEKNKVKKIIDTDERLSYLPSLAAASSRATFSVVLEE